MITPQELRHYASEPRDYRLIERVLLDAAARIEQLSAPDLPYWEELKQLRSDNARLRAEMAAQSKAYHDEQWRQLKEAQAHNARLRAAILDIIERWPTERGMDGALTRARALIMDDALRNPDKDDVKRALEQKARTEQEPNVRK